ncbi:MAG: hypothetical protein ABW118_07875 [Candidatus Thiodiazotropha sp.]
MERSNFDWSRFHAYRVFDEFVERFVLNRRSYITRHENELDFESAFHEIHSAFSEGYDDSNETFDTKVERQFADASEDSKIVFANVEYLWAILNMDRHYLLFERRNQPPYFHVFPLK